MSETKAPIQVDWGDIWAANNSSVGAKRLVLSETETQKIYVTLKHLSEPDPWDLSVYIVLSQQITGKDFRLDVPDGEPGTWATMLPIAENTARNYLLGLVDAVAAVDWVFQPDM